MESKSKSTDSKKNKKLNSSYKKINESKIIDTDYHIKHNNHPKSSHRVKLSSKRILLNQ